METLCHLNILFREDGERCKSLLCNIQFPGAPFVMVWWKTLPGQNEKLAKGQIDLKQFRQGSEFVGFYKNHNLLSCVGCVRSSQLWSKLALLTMKLKIWSKVITCCCEESPVLSRLNLLKSENFIFKSHTFSRNLKSAAFTFLIVFNTRAVSALQSPSLVTERPLVASQRLFLSLTGASSSNDAPLVPWEKAPRAPWPLFDPLWGIL